MRKKGDYWVFKNYFHLNKQKIGAANDVHQFERYKFGKLTKNMSSDNGNFNEILSANALNI